MTACRRRHAMAGKEHRRKEGTTHEKWRLTSSAWQRSRQGREVRQAGPGLKAQPLPRVLHVQLTLPKGLVHHDGFEHRVKHNTYGFSYHMATAEGLRWAGGWPGPSGGYLPQ